MGKVGGGMEGLTTGWGGDKRPGLCFLPLKFSFVARWESVT